MKLLDRRILLVEDCPDQQRLILHFLKREGADVTLECDGPAAVETARKAMSRNEPFHAAVMDLYLHQSDGIQATREILMDNPKVAIIAVTAYGSPEIESEWRHAGCAEYLPKPLSAEDLVEATLRAIDTIQPPVRPKRQKLKLMLPGS